MPSQLLSVHEVAARLAVSPRRVRALAAAGSLPAVRLGHIWAIEGSRLEERVPAVGRPLSARNAWALLALLSGDSPSWVDPAVRSRLRRKMRDQEWLLHAILRSQPRAVVSIYRALPRDLTFLTRNARLVATGLAAHHPDLDIFGRRGFLDAYLDERAKQEIVTRLLPIENAEEPNLVLRVPTQPWILERPGPVAPPAVVAADLIDADPRARRAARNLLSRLGAH